MALALAKLLALLEYAEYCHSVFRSLQVQVMSQVWILTDELTLGNGPLAPVSPASPALISP